MEINIADVWTGFMTWEQIEPFKEQIIDMELESMTTYHFPDWKIPRSYPEQSVAGLEQHLANGNTYFWGAIWQGKLLGYRWAYTAPALDKLHYVGRSAVFVPEARGLGLCSMAMEADIKKAAELKCDEMVTMYVPANHTIAHVLEKYGYRIRRLEVMREVDLDADGQS